MRNIPEHIARQYANQYIACRNCQVIAGSETHAGLMKKLEAQESETYILMSLMPGRS